MHIPNKMRGAENVLHDYYVNPVIIILLKNSDIYLSDDLYEYYMLVRKWI